MLKIIIGKAGAGKTAGILNEIKRAVDACQGGRLLIVPEQYSHEAEKELAARCGDSMSLYAEVFSFTALARRVATQVGGGAVKYLDKGGRLLCMALALDSISSRLKVYGAARRRAELQARLLSAVDELKSAGITSEKLLTASAELRDALGDKLEDMALILDAYEAVVANGHADPSDRLNILAGQIAESTLDENSCLYIDGFTDFTYQEREVIKALLKKGVQLTVCLTVDSMESQNEIYSLSRCCARALMADCRALNVKYELITAESPEKPDQLAVFADKMFTCGSEKFADEGKIRLFTADSMVGECELAASEALRLVREEGCRWRDIAVAIRGFDGYRAALSGVFEHYGVPLFVTRKSELMSRPLPCLISLAYAVAEAHWDLDDVVSYMRTGLTGLNEEECDELENYVFKWQLHGEAWKRKADWHQHPDGYGAKADDSTAQRLEHINALRYRLSRPLEHFEERGKAASTARAQCEALCAYFEELCLPELLTARAEKLIASGQEQLAREYMQLWELTVSALEQCHSILGDAEMDMASFGRLFLTVLSGYDVGTIPVALDRVSAGDFDRMRRRHIRHLIVLGASGDLLPAPESGSSIFSQSERQKLLTEDIDLGGAGDGELWREFTLIYNCLSLPLEGLTLCYSAVDGEGNTRREALVYKRAASLFSLEKRRVDTELIRTAAPAPALGLAARCMSRPSPYAAAARDYFARVSPERLSAVEDAAGVKRGSLSAGAVHSLYGLRPRFSASQVDKFMSCKYAYFCQYGLKAKPYKPADFKPPEIGTFMHKILEDTAREAASRGGFPTLSDEDIRSITEKYVQEYVHRELNDFQEKSDRFIYLFKRLIADVTEITLDMARELRRSSFVPQYFELKFGEGCDARPIELGTGDEALTLTGVADRVDGYVHDGKLYLRVVDYKTGKKKFSLSDVWYGMGLQMLLYLFILCEGGENADGLPVVPAGVMYVPAKNGFVRVDADTDDSAIEEKRTDALRRSGIVLDSEDIVEAWEHGDKKKYFPVKMKYGKMPPDALISYERMGVLSRHIEKRLAEMASELHRGSIAADPYYRSQQDTACSHCDYFQACHFENGVNGESCHFLSTKLKDGDIWQLMEGGEENG